MDKEFYGAAEAEEENAGFGYAEMPPKETDHQGPKGMRDRPGRVALSMGFDAARMVLDRIEVKSLSARQFSDFVLMLSYSFEDVLEERYK